jgi:hypothetical protein
MPGSATRGKFGLSAAVLDRGYAHRVVQEWQSETVEGNAPPRRIGQAEAIRRAETLAASLNRDAA